MREAQSTEAANWREEYDVREREGGSCGNLMVPLDSGDEGKQQLEEGGGGLERLLLGQGQLSMTEGCQFRQHWTQPCCEDLRQEREESTV